MNLGNNQLSQCKMDNLFDNLKVLMELYLDNNILSDFDISNKTLFYNLMILDLSHNNISTFSFKNVYTLPNCEIDLSHNQFMEFKFLLRGNEKRLKFILNDNPIICDCNALELFQFIKKEIESQLKTDFSGIDSRHFKCKKPDNLYDRFLSTLNTTEMICNIEKDCPKGCKCKSSADKVLVFDCSSSHLQELPTLPKFEDFDSNKIELYAAQTQLNSIQLINVPDDLIILDLRNNSLKTLSNNVIQRFKSIDKLYLSGNPWTCDCDAVELVYFFHLYRSKIVDADDMKCADHRSFKTLEAKELCVQLIEVFVVFLMGTSLLGLFSTFFVIFKKQIKIWLYAHNCCLWWVSEEEAGQRHDL